MEEEKKVSEETKAKLPEAESVQSFVADLAGQMEQTTNVPPETEAIDQDLA